MQKTTLNIFIAFVFVYGIFSFLSLNRHSKSKPFTYHSELWADKAGYNVYLPAIFIYNFKASQVPNNLDFKTGNGFQLDSLTGKIITKYPYGVSLLQSPFWLIAHLCSDTKDGYSTYYQKSIDFAGCFYLTLGVFFLFFIFRGFHSFQSSILITTLVLFISGIFYYGIFETGMSHIYSFSCLSILLYLLFYKNKFNSFHYIIFLTFITTSYVIIRPINGIFLVPLFGYFIYLNKPDFFNLDIILKIKRRDIVIFSIITFLLISPQLCYYKYAYNGFLVKSYQNESFQFPSINRIIELLFSPNNGLLIYYPACLVLLVYSFLKRHHFKYFAFSLFVSYVLIYASWWSLSLGCSFGHRALNDVFLLFLIPLFHAPVKKWVLYVLLFSAVINFKFIFSYDTCLYTSINWDFTEYLSILFGDFK